MLVNKNYTHVLMNSVPWFHGFSFITLINVPLYHNTDNSASCLLILSYPFLVLWIVSFLQLR